MVENETHLNNHETQKRFAVYADESISETSLKHRDAFVRMIEIGRCSLHFWLLLPRKKAIKKAKP